MGVAIFEAVIFFVGHRREERSRLALERARFVAQEQQRRVAQERELRREEDDAMNKLRRNAQVSIAIIGEAYKPLRRQWGDVAAIAVPLRAAKKAMEDQQYDVAMASAQASWQALKDFRKKTAGLSGTYQVARGDTLWQIASRFSPVHRGAGWPAIWRVNQALIGDFNRLEVGWNLKIPKKRSEYAMPFWKPQ